MKQSIFTDFLRGLILIANLVFIFALAESLVSPVFPADKEDFLVGGFAILLLALNSALVGETFLARLKLRKTL